MAEQLSDLIAQFSEAVDYRLIEAVEEVLALRDSVSGADAVDSVESLLVRLTDCRRAQDRAEQVVVSLMRLRARTAAATQDAKGALTAAWNAAATKKKVGFSDNYLSAKEKDAYYSMDAVGEELAFRKAERVDADVLATLDACRFMTRGIDNCRRDLDTRIRLMSVAGQLDR